MFQQTLNPKKFIIRLKVDGLRAQGSGDYGLGVSNVQLTELRMETGDKGLGFRVQGWFRGLGLRRGFPKIRDSYSGESNGKHNGT